MKTDSEYFAEFLGWELCKQCPKDRPHYIVGTLNYEVEYMHNLKFKSWERIMPIVEKICRHVYDTEGDDKFSAYLRTFGMMDDKGNFMVRFNRCSLHEAPTLLDATYEAALEFVKQQIKPA